MFLVSPADLPQLIRRRAILPSASLSDWRPGGNQGVRDIFQEDPRSAARVSMPGREADMPYPILTAYQEAVTPAGETPPLPEGCGITRTIEPTIAVFWLTPSGHSGTR
jgi:hypothetical protein